MGPTPSIDVKSEAGWQTIKTYLPEDFEAVAKEKKVLETQYGEAKIETAEDLLKLILLHAGADLPLRQTVAWTAESGGPAVSHVTLHKKMRLASPFLRELVARLTRSAATTPERWAGYEVLLVDGSSFCGPGAEGTDARVHLQLRVADLEILDVVIEDRRVGESLKRFTWREGQLALGDRGYANPPGVASTVEQGADVLVRVNRAALPTWTPDGEPIDLMDWLRSLKGYMPRERQVVVRSREPSREVPGRLIAVRLPASEAQKARARLRRELGSKATFLDMEAAQYVVIFTTVPASRMSMDMCLELYRLRWQIELAFKRWKSLCHFDRLPNYRDDTILSWLYAKLLLALVMHRMAAGASALFPPEPRETDADAMALDAVEGRHHHLARPRRRTAAA
jgi:hypothetical protein